MEPEAFRASWRRDEDDVMLEGILVPRGIVPDEDTRVLNQGGLPIEAPPYLSFGPPAVGWAFLHPVPTWADGAPEGLDDWRILGLTGDGALLCIHAAGALAVCTPADGWRMEPLNGSLGAFLGCLLVFRDLADGLDDAVKGKPGAADTLAARLAGAREALRAADPTLDPTGSWWGRQLDRLSADLARQPPPQAAAPVPSARESSPETWIERGRAALALGDPNSAFDLFHEALLRRRGDPDALFGMGLASLRGGDTHLALRFFRAVRHHHLGPLPLGFVEAEAEAERRARPIHHERAIWG